VVRLPTDVTVAQRARWLAELSEALDEARSVIWRLAMEEVCNIDALDLSARVEAAKAEVQSMRLSRMDRSSIQNDPNWSGPVPWNRPLERSA